MKEFQSIVKEFISDRQKHIRYIVLLTVMCVVVSIAVPFSLIKPAISQTGELSCGIEEHTHTEDCYDLICEDTSEQHKHTQDCYQLICGYQEHIHTQECYTSIDNDINNYVQLSEYKTISNIFNGFTMVGAGATSPTTTSYTLASDSNSSITSFTAKNSDDTDGNSIDKVLSDFTLEYKLEALLFSNYTITYDTPIQYQIDNSILSKIEIPSSGFSGSFQDAVNIENYDNTKFAGHFTVDTNGLITITLTKEYYTKLYDSYLSVSGAIGKITFKAYTKRNAEDTNNVTFNEGGLSGTITFPSKTVSISKTNTLNQQTGEITWTVTIDNPSKLNLNDYSIKDTYINTNTNATITYEPTNSDIPLTTTLTKLESGDYKIVETGSDNTTRATKIKIEYKTTLGSPDEYEYNQYTDNATESNTAQLFDANNTQVGSDATSYCNISPVTIDKYHGSFTDNKIPWTITISNPSGLDLTGYTFSDTYINDNTNVNIIYEPTDTTPTIQLQKNDDKYQFVETATEGNKIRPTKITITYNTDISSIINPFENGSITNTATIQGGSNNSYTKSDTDTFSYTGVSLSKSGSLNESTGEITWTLTVNNQLGLDLKDFTITDNKFPSNFSNSLGTYDSSTHTFTFNSTTSQYITLTYSTNLSDAFTTENPISPTGGDVSNSATIQKGTYSKDASTSVHYNGVSISSKSGNIADDGTITWTININNPNGINIGGYTITDTKFNSTYNPTLTSDYGSLNEDKTLFTFNENVTDKNITLTYTTKLENESDTIKSSGGTITNTATLKNGNTVISTGNGSVTVSAPISVTKNGVYDYQYNANSTTYPVNNQIVWTIYVKANYGENLAGQTITDSMFSGKTLADLGLDDKSNQLEISGDTLTIKSTATLTELTIVYTTPIKDEEDNLITSNTVTVGGKDFPYTVQGDYEPYTISKSASSVVDTLVTWTITVYNHTNANSLNGFVVTDAMFSQKVGDIIVDNNATFTLSNNDLTLNVADYVKQVTITYKTKATDTSDIENPTNIATLKHNEKSWDTASATQPDYTPVNTITKSYISDTLNDTTGGTINWNIVVKKDLGFQNSNVVITDNISVSDSNASHTITSQQLKELKVYSSTSTQDGTTYTELSSSYYTIQDSNGNTIDLNSLDDTTTYTGFKIAFNNDIASDIVNIKVTYSTTADITSVDGGTTITFTNEASVTDINNPSSATTEVTKFNSDNQPFKKYAVKFSGTSNTAGTILEGSPNRSLSDLSTITDDNGTKYYVFTWAIFFDCANMSSSSLYTLEDNLPINFELCTDETYKPKTVWVTDNNAYNTTTSNIFAMNKDSGNEYYTLSTNTDGTQKITFSTGSRSRFYVMYSAKISESNLNSLFTNSNETTISNTVSAPNDTTWSEFPYTNTQTINKGNIPSGGDTIEDILDKTVNTISGVANKLHYSIDVNPEAKTLSSDGNLVLNDIFNITGYKLNGQETTTDLDISQFGIDVTSFKVYEVDLNGTKTEISNSEYSYVVTSPKTTYTPVSGITTNYSTEPENQWNTYNCLSIAGLSAGNHIKVTFENKISGVSVWFQDNYLNLTNSCQIQNIDEKTILTFDIPNNYKVSGNCSLGYYIYPKTNFTIEVSTVETENFAKRIQMVVPDGKHLCIDYYYNVSFNGDANGEYVDGDGIISGDYVSTSNTISIDTGNYSDSKTASENVDMKSDSDSSITTTSLPKIQKYDVGNYSIHLEAGFNIAKWNGSKWEYAQTMNEVTENGKVIGHELGTLGDTAPAKAVLTTDSNGEYSIKLESGVLYRLEEVTPPNKYNPLSKPMYFVSGSKSSISKIPSEAGNIIDISNQGGLKVPNNKNININVQKDWSGGTHTSDNVVVQLYKSTSKVATAEELEPVTDSNGDIVTKTLDNSNSWKATFSSYPNGDDDGNPLYYYVKEISYTVDEKTYTLNSTTNKYEYTNNTIEVGSYTPYYTDNAVNDTNTDNPIKILNTTGLKVEKVWYNANNVEITPPTDSIQFNLFYTLEGETEKTLYINTDSTDDYNDSTDGIFTLRKDNNWKLELNLPATIDDKKCTYSVEEINPVDGYTVSYVSNSDGNTGTIQIINKNPNGPETFNLEVEKQWSDGNINHDNDSVTLELWRKSNSITDEKVQDITLNKDNWQKSIPVEAYQVDDSGSYVFDSEGNKIKYEYYIVETKINDIDISNSTYNVTYNNTTNSSISPSIDIDTNSKIVIITNTPTDDTSINITVNKTWGTYPSSVSVPESITINLYKSYTENASESEWQLVDTCTLSNGNWSYIFNDLPSYVYYHVVEDVPDGWTASYSSDNPINTTSEVTITNTYSVDIGSLTVNKVWKDINGSETTNIDASSITVQLYRYTTNKDNATTVGNKVTINSPSWTYTFNNLELSDGTNPYHYYVVEDTIDGYQTTYSDDITLIKDEISNITITNQATNIKLDITKNWSDNGNHDSIKVKVYRSTDSSKVPLPSEDTPSEDENVEYTFYGLEANDSITAINGTTLDNPLTSSNNKISYSKDTTITNYTIVRSYDVTINNTDIGTNGSNLKFTVENGDGFTFNLNRTEISDITQAITINSSDVGTKTLTATKTVTVSSSDTTIDVGTLPTISHSIEQISNDDEVVEVNCNFTLNSEKTSFEITDIKTDKIIKSITIKPDTSKLSVSNEYVQIVVTFMNNDTEINVSGNYLGGYNWNEPRVEINNINAIVTKIIISKHSGTEIPIIGYEITYSNDTVSQSTSSYGLNRMSFNSVMATNDNNTLTFTSIGDGTEYVEITIDSTNWTKVISVPKADESDTPYYYWVIEDLTDNGLSTSYRSPKYSYNNDSNNYISGADGSVIITNTKIDNTTSLPMTGGTGTTKYYLIGGIIVIIAISLLVKNNTTQKKFKL